MRFGGGVGAFCDGRTAVDWVMRGVELENWLVAWSAVVGGKFGGDYLVEGGDA